MFTERVNVRLYLFACLMALCWAQNPCPPDRFGENCECSSGGGVVAQERCRPTNTSYGPFCSNRGDCICGVCECYKMEDPDQIISGPFCECDNFSCDRYRGQLCSGPEHGECVCGRCNCRPGYTGGACNGSYRTSRYIAPSGEQKSDSPHCLIDDTNCRPPDNGSICSGNGRCICGQCVCDAWSGFTGQFCEKLPNGPGKCAELKDCVLCYVHHRGAEYATYGSCSRACAQLDPSTIIVTQGQLTVNDSLNERLCRFRFEENYECSYEFLLTRTYSEGELHITAQKEQDCHRNI